MTWGSLGWRADEGVGFWGVAEDARVGVVGLGSWGVAEGAVGGVAVAGEITRERDFSRIKRCRRSSCQK